MCIPSSPCTFHTQNRKLFPLWSPLEPCVLCLSKQRLCRCQCAHFKHRRSLYHPVTDTGIFLLLPTWGARNSHDYNIKSLSSLSSLFFLDNSAVVIDFFFLNWRRLCRLAHLQLIILSSRWTSSWRQFAWPCESKCGTMTALWGAHESLQPTWPRCTSHSGERHREGLRSMRTRENDTGLDFIQDCQILSGFSFSQTCRTLQPWNPDTKHQHPYLLPHTYIILQNECVLVLETARDINSIATHLTNVAVRGNNGALLSQKARVAGYEAVTTSERPCPAL